MAAEDLLRLAWEADHDGRPALRDALLTLAILESGPLDEWSERCRARVLTERPGHFLGGYASVGQALEDPRVLGSRDRLRRKYPAERVGWLLLRARAARGTYTGRIESLGAMIDDLAGGHAEAENVRRDAPETVRGPLARSRVSRPVSYALAYPPMAGWNDPEPPEIEPSTPLDSIASGPAAGRRYHYYSMIFAIAMLLAALPIESDDERPGD